MFERYRNPDRQRSNLVLVSGASGGVSPLPAPTNLVLEPFDGDFSMDWDVPVYDSYDAPLGIWWQFRISSDGGSTWVDEELSEGGWFGIGPIDMGFPPVPPFFEGALVNGTEYTVQVRAALFSGTPDLGDQPIEASSAAAGLVTPAASATVIDFPITAPGDGDDIFNFIGTLRNTEAWAHPFTRSLLALGYDSPGGGAGGTVENILDSNVDTWAYIIGVDSYFQFDFGPRCQVSISDYCMYFSTSGSGGQHPTDWVLEGSNDGASWTTIDTKTSQSPTMNAWNQYSPGSTDLYRWIRQRYTSLGSGNLNLIGSFEFYGTHSEIQLDAPSGTEIDLSDESSYGIIEYFATKDNTVSWVPPQYRAAIEVRETATPPGGGFNMGSQLTAAAPSDSAIIMAQNSTSEQSATWDFGTYGRMRPTGFKFAPRNDSSMIVDFRIEGSNDNSSWDELGRFTNNQMMYRMRSYSPISHVWPLLLPEIGYRYIRMVGMRSIGWGSVYAPEILGYFEVLDRPATLGVLYPADGSGNAFDLDDAAHNESPTPTASSGAGGVVASILDATPNPSFSYGSEFFTANTPNSTITLDWGAKTIRPEGFAMFHRSSQYFMGNFDLEGWDGASWTVIRSEVRSGGGYWQYYDGALGFHFLDSVDYYSKLRWTQTSNNSQGNDLFLVNEVFVWGDVV